MRFVFNEEMFADQMTTKQWPWCGANSKKQELLNFYSFEMKVQITFIH